LASLTAILDFCAPENRPPVQQPTNPTVEKTPTPTPTPNPTAF